MAWAMFVFSGLVGGIYLGPQWSGCSVRIRFWPHLLPATIIAYCPRWSPPAHSGPPMCSSLFSPPDGNPDWGGMLDAADGSPKLEMLKM